MKAQVSLEYATTYGWGLLIIAVVVGSLVYFGAFETRRHSETICNLGPQFDCTNVALDLNGVLLLSFENQLNSNVTLDSFTIQDETVSCDVSNGQNRKIGDTITINCDQQTRGFEGDIEEIDALMKYKVGNKNRLYQINGNVKIATEDIIDLQAVCDVDNDNLFANTIMCGGNDCNDGDGSAAASIPECLVSADCNNPGLFCNITSSNPCTNRCDTI